MKPFDEVLPDVFGERHSEFGPDLRARLLQVYREGIKAGLYMERERLEVPADVFEVWERPESLPEDPREAPGRLGELEVERAKLTDKLEALIVEIDRDPSITRTLALRGDDLARGRHQVLTRFAALIRGVDRMLERVRSWR